MCVCVGRRSFDVLISIYHFNHNNICHFFKNSKHELAELYSWTHMALNYSRKYGYGFKFLFCKPKIKNQ
ncbi:Uncharacterised protein [Chlamydia trachomatis]|nr:Uncharacterised protein [Chlamydia trachomatis]